MASSSFKKRRFPDAEEPAIVENPEMTSPCENKVEVRENTNANKPVTPLLPSLPIVPGREYITVKRRAGYWVHFREYIENGARSLARDVLAVPISTVASESTFSVGRRHLSAFRSSLTPKIVEALLCTQDWIRPRKDSRLDIEEKLKDLEQLEKDLENTTIVDEGDPDIVIL